MSRIEVWSVDSGNLLASFETWYEVDQWLIALAAANPEGIGNLSCCEMWDGNERLALHHQPIVTGTSSKTVAAEFPLSPDPRNPKL